MRPPTLADIEVTALALLSAPAEVRPVRLRAILRGARLAAAYRGEMRRLHPLWGSGTLMSAAAAFPAAPRPAAGDRAYLEALALVCTVLLAAA